MFTLSDLLISIGIRKIVSTNWLLTLCLFSFANISYAAPTILPASGVISNASQNFVYAENDISVDEFWIWIGSSPITSNLHDSGTLGAGDNNYTVTGLPTGDVHVTLWYRVNTAWLRDSYLYTVQDSTTVLLNFDELPSLTQLSNQYDDQGVVFIGHVAGSNLITGEIGTNGVRGTLNFGNSLPNFAIVGTGLIQIRFQDLSGQPQPVKNVSIRVGDGDNTEAFGVMALDQNEVVLESHTIYNIDPGVTVSFPIENIYEIRLFGISGCSGCGGGFAFDDLSYTSQ